MYFQYIGFIYFNLPNISMYNSFHKYHKTNAYYIFIDCENFFSTWSTSIMEICKY